MKIIFDSRFDLEDVRRGSGSFYHLVKAMRRQGHEVVAYRPLAIKAPFICRLRNHIYRRWLRQRYQFFLDITYARKIGQAVSAHTARLEGEAVMTNDSRMAAFYEGERPIFLVTDEIFQAAVDFGQWKVFSNLCHLNLKEGKIIQDLALARVEKAFFPTQWACDSAINSHHAALDKIQLVRWGINFEKGPPAEAAQKRSLPSKTDCLLLFVGMDWMYKGGPIALAAVDALQARGIAAQLTIVGCVPPVEHLPNYITVIPYLDKRNEADRAKLESLYAQAHFFILPTRAEGYGIVFVEAAAYGLPSLGPNHTGVATAIADGVSGLLLPPDADGAAYAAAIAGLLAAPEQYQRLSASARHYYETEANWEVAARRIMQEVEKILVAKKGAPLLL
jgi:glycosyltransferase involved in cell wall biosynthesis